MPTTFIPGLELSERLYHDAVHPLLARHFPDLAHTAALLGPGSEVLGFDTVRSTDHDWGPRLQLFLSVEDVAGVGERVHELLAERLQPAVAGYPTNLVRLTDGGARHMSPSADGRVEHAVEVAELGGWMRARLGFDPLVGVSTLDWLATPTQVLAEVTEGAVFHDGLGQLVPVRTSLDWYPVDVWRYVLASLWQRIGQEDHLAGRCAEVGDDLGSAVVTARLVRDLMRLCLLMDRVYPPYGKWLGTAFGHLPRSGALSPAFAGAVAATTWNDRKRHLVTAMESVAVRHNDLGLTDPLSPRTRPFHDRPFPVLDTHRFSAALVSGIRDDTLRELPLTGAIDQVVDNVDALRTPATRRRVAAALYP